MIPADPAPDGAVPADAVPADAVPNCTTGEGMARESTAQEGIARAGTAPEGTAPAALIPADLRATVEAWAADDPDPADAAELLALVDDGSAAAAAELADRFAGRLQFGTAGLRGVVAAGPNRMNRAVVRAATAAVSRWLRERQPDDAAEAGVVIGSDARQRSAEFADEVAAVLAGAGIRAHMLPPRRPTPLLAFAVRHLRAAAGIMITASHNPPADNGYKLYLSDGAQIVPPADAEIEARIRGLGALREVPVAPLGDRLIVHYGDDIAAAYLDAITAASRAMTGPAGPDTSGAGPAGPDTAGADAASADAASADRCSADTCSADTASADTASASAAGAGRTPPRVVYTPLHGVALDLAVQAIERAGFPAPHVVAAQAQPDPDFPTVAFPNPEQPGALDLALADARRIGADLVLANDPDGDRLAVAVPDPAADGGWRVLTGDQLGALLGDFVLEQTAGAPDPDARIVVTTVVSSTLLSRIAAAAGARYAETLTGFKWIVRGGERQPGSRFVFGYEEALGYVIGDVVRDKDGIGAALAVLDLAAAARSAGASLLDRYDAIEKAHGVHLTAQLTLQTQAAANVMARLRAAPPATLGGAPVTRVLDLADGVGELPPADLLSYRLRDARVVVRPSGTEPKIKAYFEVVSPVTRGDLVAARADAGERLGPLRSAVAALLRG
ncbi:MAG TPA: phospho-sugar mutase [Streptosporangiaceae bacterium]|nr:phospho-sugar mutase [Streptosporangiaceae bacterium]